MPKVSTQHTKNKILKPLLFFSIAPVVIGFVIAPSVQNGFWHTLKYGFDPNLRWIPGTSMKSILVCFFIYFVIAALIYIDNDKNRRYEGEVDSMHWGKPEELTRKYADLSHVIVPREYAEQNNLTVINEREIRYFSIWDMIVLAVLIAVTVFAILFCVPYLNISGWTFGLIAFVSIAVLFGLKTLGVFIYAKRKEKEYERLS